MGSQILKTGIVRASGSTVNPNLLMAVPRSYNSASYNAYQFNLNENLVAGNVYTLQYWDANVSHTGKTAEQLSIATYWGGGMNVQAEFKIPTGHADHLIKTFTAHKNAQASDGNNPYFNIYNSPGDTSGTRSMSIGKWKLEKGSIATPYVLPVLYNEYDPKIYIEPDGSQWIRIVHHNNPASARFSSGDSFTTRVYKSADIWFNVNICKEITGYWELMTKQTPTSGATEQKYRWIQYYNPMTATYAQVASANVTKNTSSGYTSFSTGGIYPINGNTYLCTNNGSQGNWWGAFGAWNTHQSGTPAWNGVVVTTGYSDLYLRIDTTLTNMTNNHGIIESNPYPAKIGNDWVQGTSFIEI